MSDPISATWVRLAAALAGVAFWIFVFASLLDDGEDDMPGAPDCHARPESCE